VSTPDRLTPAPSPLADRLADLQGSAEWINARELTRELTPLISHAERVEAQLAAARREADALRTALEEIARLEPLGSGMKLIVHGSSARDVALAAMAAVPHPDARPAGDAQAEDYRAKWEDALARLDAVTGALALYGREAEAGRELARAVVAAWEAAGNVGATRRPIDPGDAEHLRRMALRLLARPIGERDGGEVPGAARPRPPVAPETIPTAGMESGASAADGGQGGAPGASGEVAPGPASGPPVGWPDDMPPEERAEYEAIERDMRPIEELLPLARGCPDPARYADEPEWGFEESPPADPDESGSSDRTTGLPGGLAGASRGPASPRACPEKAEMRGKLTNCRVGKMPANMRAGAAFADDGLPFPKNRYGIPMVLMDLLRDGADAIDGLLTAWDRRAEAAPGIDAGAVERAARSLHDRSNYEVEYCNRLVADILRDYLGLAPAAGRGGDAEGGRDAD
jgi:hypothetical protein